MTAAILISLGLGASCGLGLYLGAVIHRVSPSTERPVRVVKIRGELVDFRA